MNVSPRPFSAPVSRAASFAGAVGVLLIGGMALMQALPPPARSADTPAGADGQPCTLHPDGFLRVRFFGALDFTADWSGADLLCDGMWRPDGAGVRLFFAKTRPGGDRLSVLIGIDGRPENSVGIERPANVTIRDDSQGRFFSSGGPGRCWASINSATVLPGARGRRANLRIAGLVYCVGALPAIGERSSLTLGDLYFAGRVGGD